jgi:hypothetical protein
MQNLIQSIESWAGVDTGARVGRNSGSTEVGV